MKKQNGLAMVIVIWVLSLLTIMAGSFALTMRRETTVISAVKNNAEVLAVAETGLAIAQQMLLLADENKRWRADGSIYQRVYRDAEIRVRLWSEQGKIDINKASEELLRTLLQSTSADMEEQQGIVSAIIDWRDSDDLVYINGAEKPQYEDAGLRYGPANKEFQRLEELQMVLGITTEIYQQLQPLITVYSGQAQVNLQLASREVLQALGGLDGSVLDDFLSQRVENARLGLPAPDLPLAEGSGNQSGANDGVYTVMVQARLGSEAHAGIKVMIKKAADSFSTPFQILNWQQTYQEASLFNDEMEQLLVTEQDESGQQY